jgi:hypothetical protein
MFAGLLGHLASAHNQNQKERSNAAVSLRQMQIIFQKTICTRIRTLLLLQLEHVHSFNIMMFMHDMLIC